MRKEYNNGRAIVGSRVLFEPMFFVKSTVTTHIIDNTTTLTAITNKRIVRVIHYSYEDAIIVGNTSNIALFRNHDARYNDTTGIHPSLRGSDGWTDRPTHSLL